MPKRRRNKGMSKENANHVVNGSDFMIYFVVLRKTMRAAEPKKKIIIITKSMKQHIDSI